MKNSIKKKECKGAMTLEASYLFIITVCLVIICIYAMIYVYDIALARGSAYCVALKGSRMYDMTNQEMEEQLQKMAYEYVEGRGVVWEYQPEVRVSALQVEVSYKIKVQGPLTELLRRYLLPFSEEIKIHETAKRINTVRCIQTMKFMKESINNE